MQTRSVCVGCGRLTSVGPRCEVCQPAHTQQKNARTRHTYQSLAYRALRKRLLAQWRARYGNYCPGDESHPPHPTRDLTLDHIKPLRDGGSLLDEANLRVLCRCANSARR